MITKSEPGIWCDYCKTQWGRVKNVWHEKAMTEASITITSVNPKSHGQKAALLPGSRFRGNDLYKYDYP
jgi:hypothetical protein